MALNLLYEFFMEISDDKKIRGKKKMNLKNIVQVRALYDYTSQGKQNQKGEVDLR